jgi:CHAT domain-containing protein/Tfp pilus assembly protein PilF
MLIQFCHQITLSMKPLFTLFVSFIIFCATNMHAQQTPFPAKDTAYASQLLKESINLNAKSKFTEGYAKADSALLIFEQVLGRESKEAADAIHQKGNNLFGISKYEEARTDFEKALTIRLKVLGDNNPIVAGAYNNIGTTYRLQSEYDKAIEFTLKAFAIHSKIKNGQTTSMAITLNNLGSAYMFKGDFDKAIDNYEKALAIRQNLFGKDDARLAGSYSSIGNIYIFKTEYIKAIDYYQKALAIQLKNGEEDGNMANFLGNLALAHNLIYEYDKAQAYHIKELAIRLKLTPAGNPDIAMNYNNIGSVFMSKRQLDSAIIYFQKALTMQMKFSDVNNVNMHYVYFNLAECHFIREEYEKAIEFYDKNLAVCLKIFGDKHLKTAEAYTGLAKSSAKLGLFEKADSCHQKSLTMLKYVEKNNFSNVLNFETLIKSLKNLGEIRMQQYKNSGQKDYWAQAFDFTKQAIAALEFQNKNALVEDEKAIINLRHNQLYEVALKCLSVGEEQDSLNRAAFVFSEQSKIKMLQSLIKEKDALQFAGIPDSLLQKEQSLRLNITANDKRRQEILTKKGNETDKNVLDVSNKLFELKQEYSALKSIFEKKYPQYYQLKYDTKTITVEEVQKTILTDNQTLVEYFVGDSSIFVFTINKNDYKFKKINLDFPLDSLVLLMHDGLVTKYAKNKTDAERADAPINYTEGATKLYNKLILPFKKDFKKELIIVPDGNLYTIPFEALISEKEEVPYRFNAHKYLIDEYRVSYAYSATLLKDELTKKHKHEPTNYLLAMAPFNTSDTSLIPDLFIDRSIKRDEVTPLKYSGQEVANITKLMNGTSYYGKDATEPKFVEIAPNYRIIHLATHSQINNKSSNYSFLAFSEIKDSIENEFLYARELYNLSLNADMVVLSACETGVGEIQQGEGVISLARAFTYAGAKSVVTTLWQVNDEKSKILMIDFYKYLRRGLPKQEALWRAKQDFMKKIKSDPYYWAGFIGIGDMSPIKK